MKEKLGKKGIKNRLFSVLLAMVMVVSLVQMNGVIVYAAATRLGTSSTYWDVNSNVLNITGSGAMPAREEGQSGPTAYQEATKDVTSINISPDITVIGDNSFNALTKVTSVSFGTNSKLTSIGDYGFAYCSFASINIPGKVTSIGERAFGHNGELTTVSIPASVTNIGSVAFVFCPKLATVTIPASVTNIGNGAFSGCSSLKKVTVNALTPPALGDGAFDDCDATLKIAVPKHKVDDYKTAWSAYAGKIEAIPHTHSLSYVASGSATLKAYCTQATGAASCTCQGAADKLTNAVSLTISAEDADYSSTTAYSGAKIFDDEGTEIKAANTTNKWSAAGLTIPSIKYYKATSHDGTEGTEEVTNLTGLAGGDYYASVTLGAVTVKAPFFINQHIHTWSYSVENDSKLVATCTCKEGDEGYDSCEYKEIDAGADGRKVSLTLTASSANYSGSAATATLSDTTVWSKTFGTANVPKIYYKETSATEYGTIETPPSTKGKYTAFIYPVGKTRTDSNTAKVNFEIKDHNFTPATSTMTEITLDNADMDFDDAKIAVGGISRYTPVDGDMVAFGFDSGRAEYKVMNYGSNRWGYTYSTPNLHSLDSLKALVTAGYNVYIIGTVKEPSRPSSGGGSSYTPPATNATIGGESGSTTNVSVNTSGGQATVTDISKNTVDSIANSNANGSDIVLDVSKAGNSQVTKVTLTKNTVENISKALDSGDNNKTNLVVKTGNAEVAFDAAALKAIAEQASAESIQIVVENTTGANLNNSQKKVVEDLGKGNGEKQVVQTFEASIISGGRKISNFMGGNVTVAQINFTVPAGKKAANYHIYYIPTSGATERCVTWVKDGRIYFVTGHFSDYVIVYDEAVSNGEGIPVYRLYHNKLGDHLFTTNAAERDAVQKIGYKLEGVGFYASGTGNKVYRLFNKNSGEHFYTTSEAEKKTCEAAGWRFEGVAFTTVGEKKVYRLYNGKVHFYTTSEKEKDFCEAHGWKLEGVGFTAN